MIPALMQATSRESLAALRQNLEQRVGGLEVADAERVGLELSEAARLLGREPGVRRALADPSAEPEARATLIDRLLSGQVSAPTNEVLKEAVTASWSSSGDLVDAITDLSHQAVFIGAESAGSFATVEEEIFRFGRALEANGELEQRLSDQSAPLENRVALLDTLISSKSTAVTTALLHSILANPRAHSMQNSVEALVDDAAARRRRSVAIVKSPVALSPAQEERLTAALTRIYGREIAVSVDVDEKVLGGLRVQVGEDVIDGSVAGQLDDIQRRFAG